MLHTLTEELVQKCELSRYFDNIEPRFLEMFDASIRDCIGRYSVSAVKDWFIDDKERGFGYYLTCGTLHGVSELVQVLTPMLTDDIINGVRKTTWYSLLSPALKGKLTKAIKARLGSPEGRNLHKLETMHLSSWTQREFSYRLYNLCGSVLADEIAAYVYEATQIPKYAVGNVVLVGSLQALVRTVRPLHGIVLYSVLLYDAEDSIEVAEADIAEKIADERESHKFQFGDIVLCDGLYRKVTNFTHYRFPNTYALDNGSHYYKEYELEAVDPATVYYCNGCHEYHLFAVDPPVYCNSLPYCPMCAEEYLEVCEHCGVTYDYRNVANTDHLNRPLCRQCWSESSVMCSACGHWVHRDDAIRVDDRYFCSHRCESTFLLDRAFRRYTDKVTPIFYGEEEQGYGVELEVDDGEDDADCILELTKIKQIYLKHDASLSRSGIEIITHPATVKYHQLKFPWESILRIAARGGYRSHATETCGLHVHASRSLCGDLSTERDLTIAKLLYFVDENWNNIISFTRRERYPIERWANRPYANIDPVYDTDDDAILKAREKDYTCKRNHENRYTAINLQNTHTVEFRIFRGTTNRRTILACIEFCDALIKYCRGTSLSDMVSGSWNNWIKQVDAVVYPNLARYLAKKLYK